MACAEKPIVSQTSSVVEMLAHQIARLEKFIEPLA
jgi:hypothetical protein